MGKRKERRQQAAVSRRVKLDLWSEEEEEVAVAVAVAAEEEEGDQRRHESAQPASRGQHGSLQENPLSLLGQYSDEEGEQVVNELGVPSEDNAIEASSHMSCESYHDEQVENLLSGLETHTVVENENVIPREVEKNTAVLDQPSLSVDDTPAVSPGKIEQQSEIEWQAVLHEESGEYYFWNIRTGETTWEKPAHWSQVSIGVCVTDKVSGDKCDKVVSEVNPVILDTDSSVIAKDNRVEADNSRTVQFVSVCNQKEPTDVTNATSSEQASEIECSNDIDSFSHEGFKLHGPYLEAEVCNQDTKSSQAQFNFSASCSHENTVSADFHVDALELAEQGKMKEEYPPEPPVPGLSLPELAVTVDNSFVDRGDPCEILPGELVTASNGFPEKSDDFQIDDQHYEKIIQFGKTVVQQYKILAGDFLEAIPLCIRSAIEAESILSNCNALLSLGILPDFFWLHMEGELKRLESLLAVEKAAAAAEPEQQMLLQCMQEKACIFVPNMERNLDSAKHYEHETLQVASCHLESTAIAAVCQSETAVPTAFQPETINTLTCCQSDSTTCPTIALTALLCQPDSNTVLPSDSCMHEESDLKETEVYSLSRKANLTSSNELVMEKEQLVADDVQNTEISDVDMEVDDDLSSETTVSRVGAVSEQDTTFVAFAVSSAYALPFPSFGFVAPEVANYPSTVLPSESAPTLLGQTFPLVIVSQPWTPPPPPPPDDEWAPPLPDELESIPPPPPEEPPPFPPSLPEENNLTLCAPPVSSYPDYHTSDYSPDCLTDSTYPTTVETDFYSGTTNDRNTGNGHYTERLMATPYSEPTHPMEGTAYNFSDISAAAFIHWPTVTVTTEISAVAEASESAATAALVSTEGSTLDVEAKKSTKGKTVKKRSQSVGVAPMLRIGKLSNLVSKWKQAREELHGNKNDDEEEAMYDIEALERKRQKEIEEWRRQQLASGEALDNANFQPLGAIDWRERVKRAKMVETNGSGMTSQPEGSIAYEGPLQGKKPDLNEISKGLPVGWQAFWDESSGDVYYGNVATQETTWERPGT